MKRHIGDTAFPEGKITLWTPWGVQRVSEPDKAPGEPQPADLSLGSGSGHDAVDPQAQPEIYRP